MRQLLFLGYYLKNLDTKLYRDFVDFASRKSGKSKFILIADSFFSTLRYNISLLEYFQFKFYALSSTERDSWAGTGYMYEYQLRMNPKATREILENKISFLNHYRQYAMRSYSTIEEIISDNRKADEILSNTSGKLVVKGSRGQVGAEVAVIEIKDHTAQTLISFMQNNNYDLIEEYVVQHQDLMALSPSGLNTVRIFTQLNEGKVEWLGARLRISVNSMVDNMAAGNLAAPLDMESGIVNGPAVYSDIRKNDETKHPITGMQILGFRVPFWTETLQMVKQAALLHPENKSIGWDIAITPIGPELIEGNHNWCKLLWQLPVKQGLKTILEKYKS